MEPLSLQQVTSFLAEAHDVSADALVEMPALDLAERYRALGLRPGDLVLLSLPTGVALLHHFFAVIAAGGVPGMVAPGTPSARLAEMVAMMGARAVGAVRLPAGALHPDRVERAGCVEVALFAPGEEPAAQPGEVVLLTSGTSGFSSGCVLALADLVRNGGKHADSIGLVPGDAVLVSLPLHFSFALVAQALGTLARGGRLVIAGPPFNPEAYARAIEAHGVTISSLTPVLVRTLLHHGAAIPRGLRALSVGGDSLVPDLVESLLRHRPGGELYLTYGLTQAGPRVSTLAAHAEPARRHASVGLPLPGVRATLEDLGDGSGRRELLIASDTLMRRRIGLVEGKRGSDFRAPGLLATGDVFEEEDGYLFFRGRLSEYILRGGEKVCLAAVRRVATELPGVVSARTRVVSRGEEGDDFDLTLVVTGAAPSGPEPYRAALGRALRRAELPRSIEVVADGAAAGASYK